MSMIGANLSDESKAEKEVRKRKPSGKHPYKPQLATRVKWWLEDAMKESKAAQEHMQRIHAWLAEMRAVADANQDVELLAFLGKLDHEIGGLAIHVGKMDRVLIEAITESKPPVEAKKMYSEL
jgi:hypothetical protein